MDLRQDAIQQQKEHVARLENELGRVRTVYNDGQALATELPGLRDSVTKQERTLKDSLRHLEQASAKELGLVGRSPCAAWLTATRDSFNSCSFAICTRIARIRFKLNTGFAWSRNDATPLSVLNSRVCFGMRPTTPAGMRVTSALQFAPAAIEFDSFEPDTCYLAAFAVRNTSDRILRYRLVPPAQTSPFQVLYQNQDLARTSNPTIKIPPGLSVKYEITFEQRTGQTPPDGLSAMVHDALQIKGEDQSVIQVPCIARRARPIVEVEPSLCDLGLVVLGRRAAVYVTLRNSGFRNGQFVIEVLDASDQPVENALSVSPLDGSLAPHESTKIKVELVGKELGSFRSILRVRIREQLPEEASVEFSRKREESYQHEKLVDVCSKIVEHNVELLMRNGLTPVQSLFFGSLFAGETKTIETVLRNNGPQPLLFKTSLNFAGSKANSGSTNASGSAMTGEEDREVYERRKELQVSPTEGRVDPFAETLVSFKFQPRRIEYDALQEMEARRCRESDDQSSNNNNKEEGSMETLCPPPTLLSAFVSIHCGDIQAQNLTFEVSGKTFLPKLELSPSGVVVDFGDTYSQDRVDMLVSLKNVSGLPVSFKIPKTAHFSTKPSASRLNVLQSQSLIVSFTPTQLGSFTSTLQLIINNEILTMPIHVKGRAMAVGERKNREIVGGIQALPQDFQPKFKFLLPSEAKKTKGSLNSKFNRMPPYELAGLNGTAAMDEYEFQGTNNTHLTYCVKELAKRADHREGYNEYLASCRVQREEKNRKRSALGLKQDIATTRRVSDDSKGVDCDLGMEPQSSVMPRDLRLPSELKRQSDPLWLSEATGSNAGMKTKTFFDENKLIKKKFKPYPATQAEIADCSKTLDFDQLEQVMAGPKTLNFGRLSVNGVGRKSLGVQNNLPQHVLVTLQLHDESGLSELAAKTSLNSQVIPPRSMAGFDLVFMSPTEQFFQKQLTFTINGIHTRQVTIVAEVAPIMVELAPHDLKFEFMSVDLSASMCLDVTLVNTSDSTAPFRWNLLKPPAIIGPRTDSAKSTASTIEKAVNSTTVSAGSGNKPAFEILPASGALEPASTFTCQVMFTPLGVSTAPASGASPLYQVIAAPGRPGGSLVINDFQLDITGGRPVPFRCQALVFESKVAVKDKKIDFGTISVGMTKEMKLTLTNPSDAGFYSGGNVIYYASIESSSPSSPSSAVEISLSSTVGKIASQESVDVMVKLVPHQPISLDGNVAVSIQIRGGRALRIPIHALVLIPDVHLSPTGVIGFGNITIGVSVPRVVSLENHSTIPACLVLDLSAMPSDEFALVIPPKLLAHLDDASSIFVPIMDSSDQASRVERPPRLTSSASTRDIEPDSLCSKWNIFVPANTTVSFHLMFTPVRPGEHSCVLPIQFVGVTNGKGVARPESITAMVTATAILPRLLFSSAVLDFHRCVITREGIRKVPYTKQLSLTNNDTAPMKWQVDTTQLRQPQLTITQTKRMAATTSASTVIFHLAPEKGELAPGEEVKIRVSFLPIDAAAYVHDEIPLLVDDLFYINLSVRGEGIHPHLSFSENRLVLPTVPLGITSVARFFVQSTGYDHLELTYRLPLDLSKAPISLHFPKGKILSMACPKLPVEVRFTSKKSVGFNARIEFFDTEGNAFYLSIAGCSENCVLTNYSFLQMHGVDVDTTQETGKSADEAAFCFYSHVSNRFPIYLLSAKQAAAEMTKQNSIQPSPGVTDSVHSLPAANGFVEIDAFALNTDDTIAPVGVAGANLASQPFCNREIQFVMQYLNTQFLRTPVVRFPEDFSDSFGKPVYELLDMLCLKRSNGGLPTMASPASSSSAGNKSNKSGGSNQNSASPTKKDLLSMYTTQYNELIKFLKSYGAMLHDVCPEHLLTQALYIRACEDPRTDPSLLSSPALVSMTFLQRRHALEKEWHSISAAAWMKILYQVLKCFLLYRITSKTYYQNSAAAKAEERIVRACQGSNVYSEAEMVLLQWICDNVRPQVLQSAHNAVPADDGTTTTVGTIPDSYLLHVQQDLQDSRFLFHLLMAHIPTLSTEMTDYNCFAIERHLVATRQQRSTAQLQHNARVLLQTLATFGVDFGIDPATFLVRMNAREMVLLLVHLHQILPQFIPKATIEFKGTLGQVMEKSIELKNPSSKVLQYQVFLDDTDAGTGNMDASMSSAFSIESNQIILEPGKTIAFVVTFRPRFSRKVTARLVFQSVRDNQGSSLGSSSGATMVFLLESNIISRKPVRIIQIETNTYERKLEEIVIENQFPANASYRLTMTQQLIPATGSGLLLQGTAASPSTDTILGALGAKNLDRRTSNVRKDMKDASNQPSDGSKKLLQQPQPTQQQLQQTGKPRDGATDFTWCLVSQQPFFLPEFGATNSTSSSSTSGKENMSNSNNGVVNIRNQSSSIVKLEFLPLVAGNYKCQLLFLDEKIGEFMYEIHAVAHLPLSLETLEFECESSMLPGSANRFHFLRELVVPAKNPLLTRALVSLVERSNGFFKTKLKEGLKKCEDSHHKSFQVEFNSPFFASIHPELIVSAAASAMKSSGGSKNGLLSSANGDGPSLTARTDSSGSDLAVTTMSLSTSSKMGASKGSQARLGPVRTLNTATPSPNAVVIDFQPKGAGLYSCKLLLRSHHTVCGSCDLRVYELVAKVREPNVKTLLEFAAPARHSIVQEIPLANPSDSAWVLRASYGHNSAIPSMFSGPSSLQVPAKKTASYPLTFTPKWISQEKTSFVLVNPATQQQFEFELSGIGEDPLAQDHVVLSCQARTSILHEFDVMSFKTDPPGVQNFKVESDLRDVVGAPNVTVPHANSTGKYPLTFSPLVSGTYFGSITFTNLQTNEYIWYTIEANVSPPEPESTLEMRAVVRSAIAVEISLTNPLDHAVTFTIELKGDGLLGPETFTLEAFASGVYELAFSPLLVTMRATSDGKMIITQDEGAILFANDEIGQFWYRLLLSAEPAPAQELADMCCAVGDVCAQPILLQNPSEKELFLQYAITNMRNFSIKGNPQESPVGSSNSKGKSVSSKAQQHSQHVIHLLPFGQSTAIVEYTPSSLSDFESTKVVFFEPNAVSDWEFVLKGRGKPPSVMKPILVAAKVNEAVSTLFTFKNPFADTLRVDIKLVLKSDVAAGRVRGKSASGDNVFAILLKKNQVQLESFGHLQVPISFMPQYVCDAQAEIIINGHEEYGELEWRYPIHGVAEAPLHPKSFIFACQARETMEKKISCELLAVPPDLRLENETFTVEWEILPERFGSLATSVAMERALTVTPLQPDSSRGQIVLPYQVRFDPLRPYRGSIYMIIKKQSGGQWRFEVVLEVSDPSIDDLLSIESSLHQTSSITFQLRNQFRHVAPFSAEFSAGSSSSFTVYPPEGILPPYGSDAGQAFVVSFTPMGYGKMQAGQLIILTEEMQWTFNVKGTYPDATSSSKGSNSMSSSASRSRLGITTDAATGNKTSPSAQRRKDGRPKKR